MADPVITTEKKSFAAREVKPNGRERAAEKEEQVGPPKTVFREYFESAVVTVIMALFGMTFIVQAVTFTLPQPLLLLLLTQILVRLSLH